jgi:hypothetical protein
VRDETDARTGLGNVLAGMKWRFIDDWRGVATSVYPQLQFPLRRQHAAHVDGDSAWAFLLPAEVARRFKRLELDAEVGYWFGDRSVREAIYGMVVGWVANAGVELVTECSGNGSRPLAPERLVCGLGVRSELSEHLVLLGAFEPVVAGRETDRPRYLLYLGVSTRTGTAVDQER